MKKELLLALGALGVLGIAYFYMHNKADASRKALALPQSGPIPTPDLSQGHDLRKIYAAQILAKQREVQAQDALAKTAALRF